MSLEERIEKLTAALEANTAAQMEVIGLASGGDSSTKGKGKGTTTKAKDTDSGEGTGDAGTQTATVPKELKTGLAGWLGQFAKEEDKENPDGAHPEVKARKAALKKAFEGLKVTSLNDIKTADEVKRLSDWFAKAKKVDKGFGEGRFAADPVEEDGEDSSDLEV